MSELTYDIIVESFEGTAVFCDSSVNSSCDVIIGGSINEELPPIIQRIPINFGLFKDDASEEIETFTLEIRNNDPVTTFTNDPRQTTIFISDTDGEYGITQTRCDRPHTVLVLSVTVQGTGWCGVLSARMGQQCIIMLNFRNAQVM